MPPGRSHRLFALAGLATLVAACLPAGDPPAGRQVRAGRDRNIVGVLPARSPDDGVQRLLLEAPRDGEFGGDLHLLSVAGAGAATEQLLVERWSCAWPDCVNVDSRGRVYVWSTGAADDFAMSLVRIDPQTGDRREFGRAGAITLSPGRERAAVLRYDPVQALDVIEADDTVTTLGDGTGSFVGEIYYTIDRAKTLRRLAPHGAPETIKDRVDSFASFQSPEGLRLVLLYAADPPATAQPMSVLDPATLDEQRLPFDARSLLSLSPDARWALLYEGSKVRNSDFALMEVATANEESVSLPADLSYAEWRPGRSEVWLVSADFQPSGAGDIVTSIKRPGEPLVQVPVNATPFTNLGSRGPQSLFTADGDHWFSSVPPPPSGGRSTFLVGDADDPAGPRFLLNPDGTDATGGYREVSGGRLVIEVFFQSPDRSDIYLVDANSGERRLLGREGVVLAAGARRLLAKLRQANLAGDLTAIDVDTGRATLLAAEFAWSAFLQPPGPGAGAAEPGATVAFEFRARFDSPYDGIWVTALP